ncbi:MAG: DUF2093 domain-containing protein [Hyphomicrobiales bacterium]|nr:DUF2093 domain-containing protein [Hyphomicrobiales bacterium]
MNRFEKPVTGNEAQLRYLDADFKIVRGGSYVRCAVTGLPIPIEELRYWSVSRQEPYLDAAAALKRFQELGE